jgi:hypothetical protein
MVGRNPQRGITGRPPPNGEDVVMERIKAIEAALAAVFKTREFRKRGRNWFRTTDSGDYQIINLQKSTWGGGDLYLNLGWDPATDGAAFRPEYRCLFNVRAEQLEVGGALHRIRPDGVTELELPGTSLLGPEIYEATPMDQLVEEVVQVLAEPLADLMDSTRTFPDLVPLVNNYPVLVSVQLRDHMKSLGHELRS